MAKPPMLPATRSTNMIGGTFVLGGAVGGGWRTKLDLSVILRSA
eukprot:CAMPEP_0174277792 /NCGR_PEP_ID=MMETSP0439-20130205/61123_1 /TAXON_ID=0 /ORGANISM="Stereomyxa ramosa, Strain Chinc5" /LENGTH=43 /DNA_ID= /DNA_START= /DNA_END= /DNA_ORIENTATION=